MENVKNKQNICVIYKKPLPLHSLLKYKANNGDSLAQLVEHNTFNVGVMGSSPMRVTQKEDTTSVASSFFV